jgi:hypothetical protein
MTTTRQIQQPAADAWEATRALTGFATRIMGRDDYLGRNVPQVGTLVEEGRYELFAACPPGEALQMQFEHHPSAFIAVHEIGDPASDKLVANLATGLKLPLQKLTIRREGVGAMLTVIEFFELPAVRGLPVRMYSTHTDADPSAGRQIAEALLAFSRLGVVLVGAAAAHSLHERLAPLRERIRSGPWPNRQLLIVPVSPQVADLAEEVRKLVEGTPVLATSAAPAIGAGAVWSKIQAAWDIMRSDGPAQPRAPTVASANAHAAAPKSPAPVHPASAATAAPGVVPPARPVVAPVSTPVVPDAVAPITAPVPGAPREVHWQRYVQACSTLRGVTDVCLFRLNDRQPVAHAGQSLDGRVLAEQGAALLATAVGSAAALDARHSTVEVQTTLDSIVLLARVLPHPISLGMLTVGAREKVNPAALRARLLGLEPLLRAR